MSRSNMAKSRTDKAGKTVSAPTPAQVHEIVPGKYNDQDWNLMLDHDDGDEFVSDIIEEVCTSALDIIFQNYLNKQLVPFTVSQAKDAIVQIIGWQFLSRDEGEGNVTSDPGWIEDEEPAPAVTDCWAQGSVPKQIATPREPTIVEEPEPEPVPSESRDMPDIKEEDEEAEQSQEPPLGGVPHERTIIEEEALIIEGTSIPPPETSTSTESEEDTQVAKKKKYRPKYGPLKSAGVSKMTESLDQTEMKMFIDEYMQHVPAEKTPDPDTLNIPESCHSIVKLQAGRPPGRRDVFYDDRGNVVAVTKINPEKLPSHKIPTRYKVLDTTVIETPRTQDPSIKTRFSVVDPEVEAAQERLEAMRTGRYIQKKEKGAKKEPKPPASPKSTMTRTNVKTSVTSYRTGMSTRTGKSTKSGDTKSLGPRSPLPPPLIESMDVSPGVVVREGDRVKKGPRQRPKEEDMIARAMQRGLRSIKLNQAGATISVAQILENRTPVVKPIVDQNPIPPIGAYQPVN